MVATCSKLLRKEPERIETLEQKENKKHITVNKKKKRKEPINQLNDYHKLQINYLAILISTSTSTATATATRYTQISL